MFKENLGLRSSSRKAVCTISMTASFFLAMDEDLIRQIFECATALVSSKVMDSMPVNSRIYHTDESLNFGQVRIKTFEGRFRDDY